MEVKRKVVEFEWLKLAVDMMDHLLSKGRIQNSRLRSKQMPFEFVFNFLNLRSNNRQIRRIEIVVVKAGQKLPIITSQMFKIHDKTQSTKIKSMLIKKFSESELTQELALRIAKVASRSFESSRTIEERVAEMMSEKDSSTLEYSTGRRYVIENDDGLVVAHARTFVREIKTESDSGTIPVLALESVCSDPDVRGQGLGAQVAKLAFELVGQNEWPKLSLFQTPVPGFYEKLDCRIVENKFVDRTNAKTPDAWPWRDKIVMIYPGVASWPEGIIDINGPDY